MTLKNKYCINLLSFNLLNQDGKRVYILERNGTALKEYTCKFIVFLDHDFLEKLNNEDGFFYLSVFSIDNKPLIFQQIDLSPNQIPRSGLIEIAFKLSIPTHLEDFDLKADHPKKVIKYPKNKIKLQLSFSRSNLKDQSFYSDLEDGTFIDTVIPIKEATNGWSHTIKPIKQSKKYWH